MHNMKNISIILTFLFTFLYSVTGYSQDKYFTKTGKVYFNCSGGIEKVEATNHSTTCVLDTKTGVIQFAVLLKGFEFEKALMEEHFNENYVESDKYPRSEFRGNIVNNKDINYSKDGVYPAKVKGQLSIHGQTHEVLADGKITIKGGKIVANSDFKILLSDYKVEIPKIVADKISNNVNLSIDCALEPLRV